MFKTHRNFDLSTGVKNNSIAVFNDSLGKVAVIYHKTVVVQTNKKYVTLNNGGWDTVSTRIVISNAMRQLVNKDFDLFRKKGKTYITYNGVTWEFSGFTRIKL